MVYAAWSRKNLFLTMTWSSNSWDKTGLLSRSHPIRMHFRNARRSVKYYVNMHNVREMQLRPNLLSVLKEMVQHVNPQEALLLLYGWHNNVSFMELVMMRENIEEGIKLGRLTNVETSDHRTRMWVVRKELQHKKGAEKRNWCTNDPCSAQANVSYPLTQSTNN